MLVAPERAETADMNRSGIEPERFTPITNEKFIS
jgi:hypothetical protein